MESNDLPGDETGSGKANVEDEVEVEVEETVCPNCGSREIESGTCKKCWIVISKFQALYNDPEPKPANATVKDYSHKSSLKPGKYNAPNPLDSFLRSRVLLAAFALVIFVFFLQVIQWVKSGAAEGKKTAEKVTGIRKKTAPVITRTGSDARVVTEKSLESLLKKLKDQNPRNRMDAVGGLSKFPGKRAVEAVVLACDDKDAYVKQLAERTLKSFSGKKADWAVDAIEQKLNGNDIFARSNAARRLCFLHTRKSATYLSGLLSDRSATVVENARWGLVRMGNLAIEAVEPCLSSSNKYVRQNAAFILEKIGTKEASTLLLNQKGNHNSYVEHTIERVLGNIADERAIDRLVSKLGKTNGRPLIAIQALVKIGEPARTQIENELLHGNDNARINAAFALGRICSQKSIAALETAAKDPVARIREESIKSLSKINYPACSAFLINMLGDTNRDVRRTTCKLLCEKGSLSAVQPLCKTAREDKDHLVQEEAVKTLGKLKDNRATDTLCGLLNNHNWKTRLAAATSLGEIGDPKAVEPLFKFAYNLLPDKIEGFIKDKKAYNIAIESLAAMGTESVNKCSSLIDDQDFKWASTAARVLNIVRDSESTRLLLEKLKEKDLIVLGSAYKFYIDKNLNDAIPFLIEVLEQYGHLGMASYFLHSSCPELKTAAIRWAKKHGFKVINFYTIK